MSLNALDMSKRFFETAKHSDFYAQCRPTYPTDVVHTILRYLSARVDFFLKK